MQDMMTSLWTSNGQLESLFSCFCSPFYIFCQYIVSTVVSQQNYIATLKVLFIYQIIFILELLSTGDNHHQAAQK